MPHEHIAALRRGYMLSTWPLRASVAIIVLIAVAAPAASRHLSTRLQHNSQASLTSPPYHLHPRRWLTDFRSIVHITTHHPTGRAHTAGGPPYSGSRFGRQNESTHEGQTISTATVGQPNSANRPISPPSWQQHPKQRNVPKVRAGSLSKASAPADESSPVPDAKTNSNNGGGNIDARRLPASSSTGATAGVASSLRRVCYLRMDPKTEITLSQVDGSLCTHVILAFVRIDARGQLVVANQSDYNYLGEVADFKRRFPRVRVMVSVFNEPEYNGFPRLVSPSNANPAEERLKFARSTVEFLQRHQLDGIDLDWEFPNFPTSFLVGAREHERVGLTKILKSLRSAIVENFYDRQLAEQHEQSSPASRASAHLRQDAFESRVEPYLLTVAVGGQEAILRSSYELRQVANLCDWLNVMSYDYFLFKAYSPFTGPNSPLHPIVDPYVPILNKLSLSWTASRLLDEGLDPRKLVMGVPCYARAYRLLFRNTQPAPFTLSAGPRGGQIEDYLNYREVLEVLARDDTVVEFDQRARVPYLLTDNGYTWISYENPQSVREKVRFVLNKGLGGYMTWNLNSDDFLAGGGSLKSSIVGNTNGLQNPSHRQSNLLDGNSITTGHSETFPLHRAMLDEFNRYFDKGDWSSGS